MTGVGQEYADEGCTSSRGRARRGAHQILDVLEEELSDVVEPSLVDHLPRTEQNTTQQNGTEQGSTVNNRENRTTGQDRTEQRKTK